MMMRRDNKESYLACRRCGTHRTQETLFSALGINMQHFNHPFRVRQLAYRIHIKDGERNDPGGLRGEFNSRSISLAYAHLDEPDAVLGRV
jgi:hypothetical protein